MVRGAITLDLSTDGVPELLADFQMLVVWEAVRRMPAPAVLEEIAADVGASGKSVQHALDQLAKLGLVEAARAGRGRVPAYRALRGPLVVTFDPSDPKTAFRLAAARLALLAHLRRLGNARTSRAARKGAAMFSEADMCGKSAKFWNAMPTPRCSGAMSATSCPPISMVPALGSSTPAMRRSRMVLPVPEPPKITTISPALASRFNPSKTLKDL